MITGTFFYADFSVRSFFCLKRGDEFHTFVNSITDAAGGCVLKEKVCEIFFFRQRTEAGQDNPWSPFFIWIGIVYTSSAPAFKRVSAAKLISSPVISSRLQEILKILSS